MAVDPNINNPFAAVLREQRLELVRKPPRILQVNVGLICDLACRHCHLEAGPQRREIMSPQTMAQTLELVRHTRPEVVDITGGAPELVPGLADFLEALSGLCGRIMLRSNLTALSGADQTRLLDVCVEHRIVLVASFPAVNEGQADAQRGSGVHLRSLEMLRHLNRRGYGQAESGLELNLVANPSGAFLPANQQAQERKFKQDLERRWGIVFNHLYTFANMPLGRFRSWLEKTGNYPAYLTRLQESFNPAALPGLMCRTLVSVAWDGTLFDCDFNQAAGIPLGGEKTHITEITQLPAEGTLIATGEHCFACTAGSGFT